MRYLHVLFLLCALVFASSAQPLFAQSTAGDRTPCAMLGSMTVSARFGLPDNAIKGGRAEKRTAAATLNTAVTLCTAIGCAGGTSETTRLRCRHGGGGQHHRRPWVSL